MVRASDRAGNQTVSYRTFQVTKKKTTAEKVITSVKTALGKTLGIVSENEEHAVASSMSEEDKEVENVKKSGFEGVYIPICMITFLVIAGGVGYVLMLRKR
jgi:hypothetical protein